NSNALPACTSDANCGGSVGACHEQVNCFFGPPREVPNPSLHSLTFCMLDIVEMDASGTFNPTTGDSILTLPLTSEIYITGNFAQPCPHCCIAPGDGTGCSGTCTYGANPG